MTFEEMNSSSGFPFTCSLKNGSLPAPLQHLAPGRGLFCSIETVEDMIKMGVYVNDLNLHDSSRELILAGTQQSDQVELHHKPPPTTMLTSVIHLSSVKTLSDY